MKKIENLELGDGPDSGGYGHLFEVRVNEGNGETALVVTVGNQSAAYLATPADLLALQDWLGKHFNRINGLYRRSQAKAADGGAS